MPRWRWMRPRDGQRWDQRAGRGCDPWIGKLGRKRIHKKVVVENTIRCEMSGLCSGIARARIINSLTSWRVDDLTIWRFHALIMKLFLPTLRNAKTLMQRKMHKFEQVIRKLWGLFATAIQIDKYFSYSPTFTTKDLLPIPIIPLVRQVHGLELRFFLPLPTERYSQTCFFPNTAQQTFELPQFGGISRHVFLRIRLNKNSKFPDLEFLALKNSFKYGLPPLSSSLLLKPSLSLHIQKASIQSNPLLFVD